jgi:hypothetical protein
MILSPKWGMWISIAAAIISALLLCGAEFTTLFGTVAELKIFAALGIFNALINGANAVLHMIPASQSTTISGAAQFPLGPQAKNA